jgi:sigma-E factor negative regulatory protein RseA
LADGEASAQEASAASADWAADPGVREAWHTYHLIGDALRSEELAAAPERDERFLQALRERLRDEPAVLAPGAAPARPGHNARRQWRRWSGGVAAVAGVMAVAVVAVGLQSIDAGGSPGAEVVALPSAATPPAAAVVPVAQAPVVVPGAGPASAPSVDIARSPWATGEVLRNRRLDEALSAKGSAPPGSAPADRRHLETVSAPR